VSHQIQWLGHSSLLITSESGVRIAVDPWIKGNPRSPLSAPEDIGALDFILITHDHFDHVGDTIALSAATGCTVVGQPETIDRLKELGLPANQTIRMNTGGTVSLKGVPATMTAAWHTSQTGVPAGYLLRLPDAHVYCAGDTAVFGDMALLDRLYRVDVAVLPVGGHFTMDAQQAALAVELLKPKALLPVHWGTFPALAQDLNELSSLVEAVSSEVEIYRLQPGDTVSLGSERGR